ncbi:MAG: flagellar biosynthesis regulator FlaF [Alphaproteobacteria bacterium]
MQNAAKAYGSVAQATISPRELEANLLNKAAMQLQAVKDNWDEHNSTLDEALYYNRKLWSVFVASVAEASNPLPQAIRNNVASLSVFIFNHTIDTQLTPVADKLDVLITINREIAAGLRSSPEMMASD